MQNNQTGSHGFYSYLSHSANAVELSESKYNLIIGGMLTWGFFLNYLMIQFVAPPIMRMMLERPGGFTPIVFGGLLAYIVLVLMGSAMVRSRDKLKCFLGYHLIAVPVGLLASIATIGYDPDLVVRAVLLTAIVTLGMMIVSTIFPSVFERMMPALGVTLLIVIVAESIGLFFFRFDSSLMDWAVLIIISLYVGYDWVRANSVQRTATNAIAAASALYLDIINIFLRLLRILARSRSND